MSYISFIFFVFILLTMLIYYCISLKHRWWVLLIASVVFYGVNSDGMPLIILSAFSIWLAGCKISKNNDEFLRKKKEIDKVERKALKSIIKKRNKKILISVCVLNVALLVIFKYSLFLTQNMNTVLSLFKLPSIPIWKIVVPLGISYYTLMAISYLADVYMGKYNAEKNFFKLLLFLIYFPHIVEGPIGRFDKLSKNLTQGNTFSYKNFQIGIFFILMGLTKKLVIADRIALFVNEVFGNYSEYAGLCSVLAIIGYVVQIYCDFSGSIEVISGVSALYGVHLESNFRQPFFSKSIQEFWRRWHITLGAWLRDYIFYPISLSKKVVVNCRKIRSTYLSNVMLLLIPNFAVWMIMGIWHGASWKYVFYGFYYFLVVSISIALKPICTSITEKTSFYDSKIYAIFQMIRTFAIVAIGMLFFRADTVRAAFSMLGSCFVSSTIAIREVQCLDGFDVLIIAVFLVIVFAIDFTKEYVNDEFYIPFFNCPLPVRWILAFFIIGAIAIFGVYGPGYDASAFIYGGF